MKKDKRTSKITIVLLVVLSIIIMYGIPIGIGIWVALSDSSSYEINNNEVIINKGDLIINDLTSYYDEEFKTFYVEGHLENKENKKYEYVYITFIVYDKDGNILGEAYAHIDSLDANGIWKFKAKYLENDALNVSSYKFSSIKFY